MGEEATKFISEFHQLSGESAKERQANSFKLFHNYQNHLKNNTRDLIFISQHLKPTTHLERILQIDFFIYFRRFAELYAEFLTGNDIVLSKLAKQRWFFIKAFAHLSSKEFVEEVLPQVGYNVKLKILRRLVVSENRCDEIFEALRERYGLFLALNVLTKCSNKKILEVLNTETIRLTFRQFEQIHKRDSSLTRVYIEKRSKYEGSSKWLNDSPIFNFLALKNPKLFAELVQDEEFVRRLGRRTSKAVIKAQKEKILEKPKLWIDLLNSSKLVRHLGKYYKELFFGEGYPDYCWKNLLSHYPKKHQFEIYKTIIHDKIHRHKFGDNPDAILPEILHIIPEANKREEYARIKYEKDADDDYLQYFTPTFCIQEFMNKLPNLKKRDRQKYLKIAVKSCILNKDREGLSNLCGLVAYRLKNDGINIRQDFFSVLCEQKSTFFLLTKEHWTLIMEIDATIIAQEEYNAHSTEIRLRYVEFLIKNNAHNLKDVIAKYPIDWLDNLYWSFPNFKQFGKLLQEMIKIGIEIGLPKPGPNNAAAVYDCELADKVKTFNKKFPKYAVNIFQHERMRKSVFQMMQAENLDDNTWLSFQGIQYMVCQKNTSDAVQIMHKLFFANIKKSGGLEHCLWFAKHHPKTLQEHFEVVLENYSSFYRSKPLVSAFWKTIKKLSHFKLDETAMTYCQENMQNDSYEDKKHLVQALLLVSDSTSSVNLIKFSYMPVSSTVDLTDESVKDLYAVQSEFIKNLHYSCEPEEIAQVILNFCKGDYLKHALHPLYSCCYQLPEKNASKIIEELFKIKALSAKKHSLHLSCAVLPQKSAVFYLEENSVSSSLSPTLRYFNNNPSPTLWTLLEKKIVATDETDLEAFKYLFDVSLPSIYTGKLFECVWTILSQYKNTTLKKTLITKAGKSESFTLKFVEQLIEDCLLKEENANVFIANLLLDFSEDKKFEAVKKSFITLRLAKRKLKLFIKTMFDVYIERKKANTAFANKFSAVFNEVFDPHEAFEEFVFTNLMRLKNETVENSAEIVVNLFGNFKQTYGTATTLILAGFMQNTLPQVFKRDDQIFELCYLLSKKVPQGKDDFLWITKLLPRRVPECQETFTFYSHLKNKLIALNDDTVKLIFNCNLMSDSNNSNLDQELLQ